MNSPFGYSQFDSEPSTRLPWLRTPLRCHLVGTTVLCTLLTISLLCWFSPQSILGPPMDSTSDIVAAVRLIGSRGEVQRDFEAAKADAAELQRQIVELQSWLPRRINWQEREVAIETLAQGCEVQVSSIQRGVLERGSRVGVWNAKVELAGTFPAISRFIQRSAELPLPFWTHDVSFRRDTSRSDSTCLATVSIRIPIAATGTLADKLYPKETVDVH
ncbi:hypothetical protein [Rhodopirellula sp. MGV]|uniref:hypothetical protein n=1 Tax=Rhodopirellula sp. MGV TaxID=2023130 RepID=UPI000B978E73|nr:hypothetical protein [Rhodopirellula sp. MGV]OYP35689.1 hypothetical protein CGZ80_10940 [Rhodopirellula sp. MGV]PNY34984.1 hypothetical protein C2E31_20415 [Rhodopirellula baltica]